MRLPRMTTRRWMAVVAAVSIALGAALEVKRLKRNRDVLIARAQWHGAAETYYSALVRSAAFSPVRGSSADPGPQPDPGTSADPNCPIDRWASPTKWDPARADTEKRFREARAMADAMEVPRRKIIAEHARRQAAYHQRQATYHAALRRKYESAAARPWLSVAPDPHRPN